MKSDEAEHGALRVELEDGLGDRAEADRAALADLDRAVGLLELLAGLLARPGARCRETSASASSSRPWMKSQLGDSGHVAADEQDADAEHGAEAEGDAPADVGGEDAPR